MNSTIERARMKRTIDTKYSEATKAKSESAKRDRKEKCELKHSSLQNQCWSWRFEYYSFLF